MVIENNGQLCKQLFSIVNDKYGVGIKKYGGMKKLNDKFFLEWDTKVPTSAYDYISFVFTQNFWDEKLMNSYEKENHYKRLGIIFSLLKLGINHPIIKYVKTKHPELSYPPKLKGQMFQKKAEYYLGYYEEKASDDGEPVLLHPTTTYAFKEFLKTRTLPHPLIEINEDKKNYKEKGKFWFYPRKKSFEDLPIHKKILFDEEGNKLEDRVWHEARLYERKNYLFEVFGKKYIKLDILQFINDRYIIDDIIHLKLNMEIVEELGLSNIVNHAKNLNGGFVGINDGILNINPKIKSLRRHYGLVEIKLPKGIKEMLIQYGYFGFPFESKDLDEFIKHELPISKKSQKKQII